MITFDDVLLTAPELSTLTTEQRDQVLADAYLLLNEGVCGDRLDLCARYLAAHLATLSRRRGLGGAVTGQSVGQVSRSYASPTDAFLSLPSTSYGQTLQTLIRTNPAARWVVA